MASFNKVIVLGNVGRTPEMRSTTSGKPVCNFSLATSYGEHTEWHSVVAWDKLADICGQYVTKGKSVMVEGRLQTRSWEGKDGNKKYATEIVATNIQLVSPKTDNANPARGDAYEPAEDLPY